MIQTPYRSYDFLESAAETALRQAFGAEYVKTPQRVDIDRVAEFHFGLNLDYQHLSADGNTLGMTVFGGGTVDTYSANGAYMPTHHAHGTVLLDIKAMESLPESRMRFTLAHECAHFALHEKELSLAATRQGCAIISKFQIATNEDTKLHYDKMQRRQELQANRYGAALLMPKTSFSRAYHELAPNGWDALSRDASIALVQELAATFGTSLEATAYRISDLRLVA